MKLSLSKEVDVSIFCPEDFARELFDVESQCSLYVGPFSLTGDARHTLVLTYFVIPSK